MSKKKIDESSTWMPCLTDGERKLVKRVQKQYIDDHEYVPVWAAEDLLAIIKRLSDQVTELSHANVEADEDVKRLVRLGLWAEEHALAALQECGRYFSHASQKKPLPKGAVKAATLVHGALSELLKGKS